MGHNEKQQEFYDKVYKAQNNAAGKKDIKKQRVLYFLDTELKLGGAQVLEVGCGDGTLTGYLLEKGATVTAIDISKNAIISLGKKFSGYVKKGRLKAVCADAVDFMKKDRKKYDIAVGAGIIHHIPKAIWKELFSGIYSRLKPEGMLAFAPEPNAGGLYSIAWRTASFFYNKVYKIPYDDEVEKGTLDMIPGAIVKALRAAGFSKAEVKPYQVLPHFSSGLIAAIDDKLIRIFPGSLALYITIKAGK